jgi:hypothetical protein
MQCGGEWGGEDGVVKKENGDAISDGKPLFLPDWSTRALAQVDKAAVRQPSY